MDPQCRPGEFSPRATGHRRAPQSVSEADALPLRRAGCTFSGCESHDGLGGGHEPGGKVAGRTPSRGPLGVTARRRGHVARSRTQSRVPPPRVLRGRSTSAHCSQCAVTAPPQSDSYAGGASGPRRIGRSSTRPVLKHGPRSLTCARVIGLPETQRRNESEGSLRLCPGRIPSRAAGALPARPDSIVCGAAQERTRWDPKDGELCLSRTKSEETLMEVRSDSDVQIDRQTWV